MSVRLLTLSIIVALTSACAPDDVLRDLGFGTLLDGPAEPDDGDVPGNRVPAPPPPEVPGVEGLEDVADFCARNPDSEEAPGLLPLPEVDTLPTWCDEDLERDELLFECGGLEVIEVTPGELREAVASCSGACHFRLAPGNYEGVDLPRCSILEGAGAADTTISGQVRAERGQNIIARVSISDSYSALSAQNDPLISESVLVGGYEGASAGRSSDGFRVCRTAVTAGYGGLGISWGSRGLRVAGSSIATCYEGVAGSWGSSGIEAVGNFIYGHYNAVGTSWGTVDILVEDNTLASDYAAVDIHIAGDASTGDPDALPESFDVIIRNNTILSGDLPAASEDLGIVVEGNTRE
jgi:hypothetical protein